MLEAELSYDGVALRYDGTIPSSFGMDFIEIRLDPALQNRPLAVEVQGNGSVARFNVQVWKLAPGEAAPSTLPPQRERAPGDASPPDQVPQSALDHGVGGPRALTPQPETIAQNQANAHVYLIPQLDTTAYNRLALIITRLDADEATDPAGSYRITLE
jgi:hypothetical protein